MKKAINLLVLLLGILSLFFEYISKGSLLETVFINTIDFSIVALSLLDVLSDLKKASYRSVYLRRNMISLLFLAVYIAFFIFSKYFYFYGKENIFKGYASIIVFRNIFIFLKIFSRFQKLSIFLQNIITHPSQTIVLSFLMLIVAGSLLLSMPFSSADGSRIPFLDSFFTSTSAVCVTGLAVVDTASGFSIWGKIIILFLIQAGGLGIMIISFSALFIMKRGISIENKLMLSYMVDEDEISNVASAVKRITAATVVIELSGAGLLFLFFSGSALPAVERLFYSLFHSVSAFCNAGFALYSDSLVSFRNNSGVMLTVSFLIIAGGLGFSVINDIYEKGKNRVLNPGNRAKQKISLNTVVVLQVTALLLLAGTLLFYYSEHGRTMKEMSLADQYVNAFFQSVTLRTAGFNSIDFNAVSVPLFLLMTVFMFIGGATGSTAGGVKVNNIAVILSYFKSVFYNRKETTLYNYQLSPSAIIKSFTVIVSGMFIVTAGFFILSVTEDFPLHKILFETVSAFGTVGLSTGITPMLSAYGKIIIIILMFLGRLGPLTIVTSLGRSSAVKTNISYPEAEISIG